MPHYAPSSAIIVQVVEPRSGLGRSGLVYMAEFLAFWKLAGGDSRRKAAVEFKMSDPSVFQTKGLFDAVRHDDTLDKSDRGTSITVHEGSCDGPRQTHCMAG